MHNRCGTPKYDSQDNYTCQRYYVYPSRCTLHHIKTSTIKTLVLDAIRTVSGFVREDEDEFVRLVRETHDIQSADAARVQQKQLAQSRKRHRELDSLIKQFYEDKVKGELTAKRFEILSGEYETEQEDLERQIAELQEGLAAFDVESDNADRFIKLVRRYTEIPELTATILNEYISKIIVHEADKSSGRWEQDVEIHFNFIGEFTVPGQEEPKPFDPIEHRREQWRASYQRRRENILAKLSAKRAEERTAKLAAKEPTVDKGETTVPDMAKIA